MSEREREKEKDRPRREKGLCLNVPAEDPNIGCFSAYTLPEPMRVIKCQQFSLLED
jgi:hypothetical protein